ncbi:hypothetical protein ACWCQS_13240 [Streptomyces sp. NPDC002076]
MALTEPGGGSDLQAVRTVVCSDEIQRNVIPSRLVQRGGLDA